MRGLYCHVESVRLAASCVAVDDVSTSAVRHSRVVVVGGFEVSHKRFCRSRFEAGYSKVCATVRVHDSKRLQESRRRGRTGHAEGMQQRD